MNYASIVQSVLMSSFHITLAGQGPFPTLPPLLMKERMTLFCFVSSTTGVSRPLADFFKKTRLVQHIPVFVVSLVSPHLLHLVLISG